MNMRTPRPLLQDDDEDIMEMPPQEVDFSEYMWMMEEMEEFDQQVNIVWLKMCPSLRDLGICHASFIFVISV